MLKTFTSISLKSVTQGALLLGAMVVLGPLSGSAQTTSRVQQTFSTNPTASTELPFTSTVIVGGTGQTGYFTTTGDAGLGAYGASDGNNNNTANTIQLDFLERTFAAGSGALSPNKLTFDLASVGAGNGGKGFEDNSKVQVFLDINRAGFPTAPQFSLTGPAINGQIYHFGTARTETYDYASTNNVVLTGGQTGISTVVITLPSSSTTVTNVAVRIVIGAANKAHLLIDNVTLSSGNASPLPVELTRFSATAKAQAVNLSWATASEKNNDRFEIQRSATGEAFQTIGTVKGQGNSSSTNEYVYVDSRPLAGQSYYRLRQVDTDGTSTFSPVATVQGQYRTDVAVYPNPSASTVTLPATLGSVHYRIINPLGQAVLSGKAAGNDRIDLTTLAKGTFFLELTGETGRSTQRLVRE